MCACERNSLHYVAPYAVPIMRRLSCYTEPSIHGLESLEGLGRCRHLEAEGGHEDQVGVGAQGEEPVAVERAEGGDALGVEAGVSQRRLGVGEILLAELVVGLEAVEAAIERIAGRGRESVVKAHATGHVTTALPWCQEGS